MATTVSQLPAQGFTVLADRTSMRLDLVPLPQDRRLPQRRFASPSCLRLLRSIRVARQRVSGWAISLFLCFAVVALQGAPLQAQGVEGRSALGNAQAAKLRAKQFLAGRAAASRYDKHLPLQAAAARAQAQQQHAALVRARDERSAAITSNLAATWQPLGPVTVSSISYGTISGRITAIAIDPNDSTGNTVWVGTTGGGVWRSTSAAGPLAAAGFAPLTDVLPVFTANEGAFTVPSLSIGAVAVQPAGTAVVLAGTGDPNDAIDSYYGDGILRSADGGQTWTLASLSHDGSNGFHSFQGLATAGLAWSTATPTLAVAAMSTSLVGELVSATASNSVPGLYFSTDAGNTWQMSTVYDGAHVVQTATAPGTAETGNNATSVVWDPQRGMFFAALSLHGYYSSTDGQTWHRLANQPGTGLTTANCPAGSGTVGSTGCPIFRGALAVQPATGDMYALTVDLNELDQGLWQDLCNMGANGQCATASPTFANRIDKGALEAGQTDPGAPSTILQGSYDLALAAAPAANNGTVLFAGTVDLYRCTLEAGASACTLRNTTNAGNGCNAPAMVAPAQHALAATAPASGAPLLYLGNDGGLWRSLDGVAETGSACSASDASHFDNLNPAIAKGGSLAEIVGFAQDPQSADTLLAGLGANGTAATNGAGALAAWAQMSAGEGGFPQIDATSPANWYVTVGAGIDLKVCELGSNCAAIDFLSLATVGSSQVKGDLALLDAPTALDPQNTANLLAGTCRVWRGPAANGAAWSSANALSPAMDGSALPCTETSPLIRALGAGGPIVNAATAANSGSRVLYAGIAGVYDGGGSIPGHLFVTKGADTANSRTAWTDIAYGAVSNSSYTFNSMGFDVSSVVTDLHDATGGTVYATVMGFGSDSTLPHVYRSSDFGAHWMDISANLPNAPANSLAIDPNDANTVYVAMDTGVYVTQGVSACATQNCWSPLGAGLPNAPVTQLEAAANLPTGDGRLGMLRAGTYGRGLWQTPLLSAVNAFTPALSANPTALSFGSQPQGTASATQTVTLTSTGTSPVTISSIALTGDFTETDTCVGRAIAVGATCTVSVTFAPTATGTRSGQMTVYANISGGQVLVTLNGTASAPSAIVLTPLFLSFPATTVSQTAASKVITVSNTGQNPATISNVSVSGDFAIKQNTCGTSLPSQTGCSIVITFTPTGSGTRTGTFTVVDSAGTQTAQLSGVGQAPATDTLSPSALTFGQQQVGTTSAAQQLTLTNAGDLALTNLVAVVTSGDFTATNACSSSLAAHSMCAISVAFVPTATGARMGTLTVTDQVRTQTVSLSGIAVAPAGVSLTPQTVGFASTGVGLSAPLQTITLTNNGGLPLALTSIAANGDFALVSTTCGNSLAAGGACALVVSFTPTAAGPRTGTLILQDSASGGTQTVALNGIGVDFTLTPNGQTTVDVSSSTSATFPIMLNSLSGLSGKVTLTCTGAPANSVCTVSPASAALGGSVQLSVVVQTGVASTAFLRPFRSLSQGTRPIMAGIFAPFVLLGLRRRRKAGAVAFRRLMLCLVGVLFIGSIGGLTGCGSTRLIPFGGTGTGGGGTGTGGTGIAAPTPSGSYTVTVAGTAAGVVHAVKLTLTVQ